MGEGLGGGGWCGQGKGGNGRALTEGGGGAVAAILQKTSVGKVHAVYSHQKRW